MIEVETNPKVNVDELEPGSVPYREAVAKRDRFKTCQCPAMGGAFSPDKAFENEDGGVMLLTKTDDGQIVIHSGENTGNAYRLTTVLQPEMLKGIVALSKKK